MGGSLWLTMWNGRCIHGELGVLSGSLLFRLIVPVKASNWKGSCQSKSLHTDEFIELLAVGCCLTFYMELKAALWCLSMLLYPKWVLHKGTMCLVLLTGKDMGRVLAMMPFICLNNRVQMQVRGCLDTSTVSLPTSVMGRVYIIWFISYDSVRQRSGQHSAARWIISTIVSSSPTESRAQDCVLHAVNMEQN